MPRFFLSYFRRAGMGELWLLVSGIVLVSAQQIVKYFQLPGLVCFAVGTSLALAITCVHVKVIQTIIRHRAVASTLWVLLGSALVIVPLVFYPSGQIGIHGGCDRDDALVAGGHSLLRGENPYNQKTYLGNALSPLPGALLIAAPFVLSNHIELQNSFWIFVTIVLLLLRKGKADSRIILAIGSALAAVPILRALCTGDDLLANGLYVFCALIILSAVLKHAQSNRILVIVSFLMCGIACSSRINFIVLVPLILAYSRFFLPRRWLIIYGGILVFSIIFFIAPAFMGQDFSVSPFHIFSKLNSSMDGSLHAAAIACVAGLIVMIWQIVNLKESLSSLLISCTLIQGIPWIILAVLSQASGGYGIVWYSQYCMLFFCVLIIPLCDKLAERTKAFI